MGGATLYNIESLTATQSGGFTTVVLSGSYFGSSGDGGKATGSRDEGDLYINTNGWVVSTPSADHHDDLDTFTQAEGWNYVVSFATGDVYSLSFDTFGSNILQGTGSSTWGGSTFTGGQTGGLDRTDQAWRGGYGSLVWSTGVSVSLDTAAETLTFVFPNLPGQPTVDNWGFHWTMGCGNDVIEGQGTPTVPEPGTLLLLGLSLAGLAVYRRRAR